MRATPWLFVGLLLVTPAVAQPALTEPPDFPPEVPDPGPLHPGTGCFWLAGGSIEPGDVDHVEVTLPFDSDRTVVDIDFSAAGPSSMLLASIPDVISAFSNSDGNNANDGLCGLGADSDPVGSTQDSAFDLGATPAGSVIDLAITGEDDFGFIGNHTQQFTYDVWVYAVGIPTGCTSDADCDDGVDCTTNTCDLPAGDCVYAPDHTACDNEDFCDGTESCDPVDDCQPGTPPDCNDGVDCTIDACSPVTDSCQNQPSDERCDDDLFCNGAETCDPVNDCQAGTWPCLPGEICDEVNGCQSVALPTLDIKPGACPNRVAIQGRGVLPIALAGTADIAVTDADLTTLTLSRADGVGGVIHPNISPPGPHIVFGDVSTPFTEEECTCHTLTDDGVIDLIMMFRLPDLVGQLELDQVDGGASVELTLTGALLDGTVFTARDCLQVIQRRGGRPTTKSRR